MDGRGQAATGPEVSHARVETLQASRRGLECPRCGCRHFRVLHTRRASGGRILRRRECRHCGRRMTTYEKTT